MINNIKTVLSDVSLSKDKGKYLADKSYGFDTIYFMSKFLLHNAQNRSFNKGELRSKAIKYTEDIFQLEHGTAGAVNYFYEAINLLTYSNVLTTSNDKDYFVSETDILKYISEQPENAYIFVYLVAYMTFKNDGLLPLYEKYVFESDIEKQHLIVLEIYKRFVEKSVSIIDSDSNWARQLVKYSFIVLGFANKQRVITRTLNVKNKKVDINDISLNVKGTRTPIWLPKKNDYLQSFNSDYVCYCLHDSLFRTEHISPAQIIVSESIAQSLAELKLAMLDDKIGDRVMNENERQQYIETSVRTRNKAVQTQFRKALFENNAHVCPICGFSFEKFLIASHIKPYAKCEDTYDAINHFNGLLLCPNHDRLFEDAKYMTIEYNTGRIVLSKEAETSRDYGNLLGLSISKNYINSERRHYLQWHNRRFAEHND